MCGRRQRESGADSYGCYGDQRLWLDCPHLWAIVDFIKKRGGLVGSVHLHRRIPFRSLIRKLLLPNLLMAQAIFDDLYLSALAAEADEHIKDFNLGVYRIKAYRLMSPMLIAV